MTKASPRKTSQEKSLRKDAASNRVLIVEAAKRVFSEHGFSATLHDVAKEAGVGVGTVYRRFANKQELMQEIYEEQIEELLGILHTALAFENSWECLVYYLENATRIQVRDRGMAQIISGQDMSSEVFASSKNRIAPLVNQVIERGIQDGVVRADAQGTDLIFIQVGLINIARLVGSNRAEHKPDTSELYRRYLWLALESLRKHRPTDLPLPVPALTTEETHLIFSHHD